MKNREAIINYLRDLLLQHNTLTAEINYSTGYYWVLKIKNIELIHGDVYFLSNTHLLYNAKDVNIEWLNELYEYVVSHKDKIKFEQTNN